MYYENIDGKHVEVHKPFKVRQIFENEIGIRGQIKTILSWFFGFIDLNDLNKEYHQHRIPIYIEWSRGKSHRYIKLFKFEDIYSVMPFSRAIKVLKYKLSLMEPPDGHVHYALFEIFKNFPEEKSAADIYCILHEPEFVQIKYLNLFYLNL